MVESHLYTALVCAQLGDDENAAGQVKAPLKLDPDFTAKKWLEIHPRQNKGAEALLLEAARKARLPE